MAEPEVIRLDGRDFTIVAQEMTALQENFVGVQLSDCGVDGILMELASGKRTEEIGTRLLKTILKSGFTSRVLAGLLTENGKKWTRIEAERNAANFDEITDKDEKVRMRGCIVGLVISFLESGESFSKTSQKSSSPSEKAPDTTNVEAATSESSQELSEKLRSSTRTESKLS